MAYTSFRRTWLLLGAGFGISISAAAQTQNVGIGTTAPNTKAALDISASDKGLLIPRLDSAQRVALGTPPDGLMVFQRNGRVGLWYAFGGQWFYIPDKVKAGDNLGSHNATTNLSMADKNIYLRSVNGTDTNHGLGYYGGSKLWNGVNVDGPVLYGFAGGVLGTRGGIASVLTWNSAGRVGIGTAAPAQALDVNGTTRTTGLQVTGGAASGRVLTSDASGTASWTAPSLSVSGQNLSIGGGNTVALPVGADNWGTQTAVVGAPLTGNGTSGSPLGIPTASAAQVGALSAADWTTFNSKLTTVTTSGAPFTGSGTAGAPLGISTANGTQTGVLSAADWTTFNSKGTFTLPSLTSGSVVFSNGTTLAQDNTSLFWDNANNRLGVGGNAPATRLHVVGTTRLEAGAGALQLASTAVGSHVFMAFYPDGFAAGRRAYFGFGSNASTDLHLANEIAGGTVSLAAAGTVGTVALQTNGTTRLTVAGSGNVGIGTTTPDALAALEVASTTKGFLPPRLTTTQRDAIVSPPEGLTIYNITTDCLETYSNGRWRNYCNGNCDPAAVAGSIVTAAMNICFDDDPPALTSSTLPSGGVSAWTYQWQQSTDNGVTWTNISGATSETYDPPTGSIPVTTRLRRVEMNSCGATFYSASRLITSYQPITDTPGPILGPTPARMCSLQLNDTVSFFIQNPVPNAQSYSWGNISGFSLGLPLKAGGLRATYRMISSTRTNSTLSLTARNPCGTSIAGTFAVNTTLPAGTTLGTVTATGVLCPSETVTFSVPATTGVTNYQWSYSGTGATITGNGNWSVQITFSSTATNGTLTVAGSNACGGNLTSTLAVTLNTGAPATPAAILAVTTGSFCKGASNIKFRVAAVANASSYQWSYSGTGATIQGNGNDTITVSFSATATDGSLSVRAVNGCGQSAATPTPLAMGAPPQPSSISGLTTVPTGQRSSSYSVTAQLGVAYTWSVVATSSPAPVPGPVLLSSNGASCTLTRSGLFQCCGSGTYTLTCTPSNSCGTGTARTLTVVFQ